MRRLALAFLIALVAAPGASAAELTVTMPGKLFFPHTLVALVGDTVTWENQDSTAHDVVMAGVFDSGYMPPGAEFSFQFTKQGKFPYICSIHRFMQGEVDVYGIALSGPTTALHPGEAAPLTGRAPVGTAKVAIQAKQSDGTFATVGSVAPGADGAFAFTALPRLPTEYRAVSGDLVSPSVFVSVSARVRMYLVGTSGRFVRLRVATTPDQPGAPVVLEKYVRELFTWVTVAHGTLGENSRLIFRYAPRHNLRLRVRLVEGANGYGPAVSSPVWVAPPLRP